MVNNLADSAMSILNLARQAISVLLSWLVGKLTTKRTDDNLGQLRTVLNRLRASSFSITSLRSMEAVLIDVMKYATTDKKNRDEWLKLNTTLQAIHTLVTTYCSNLEHAARVPDHRCFAPPTQAGENDPKIPEHLDEPLQQLCSHLQRVIRVLQKCRSFRHILWRRKSQLLEEIQHCDHDVTQCLNIIQNYTLPKIIYHERLKTSESHKPPLDIMKDGTPQRYRLIDCLQLTQHQTLSIHKFAHFPDVRYAAISYVWRGNPVPEGYKGAEFSIRGAENADPVGIEVLTDTCMAALTKGSTHIWIDRLCIMQTSKDDKDWQIREMYHMYRSCASCIVVPAGLRRLVRLDEETGWIHRGWTLQEALAPCDIDVLFSWKLGTCEGRSGDGIVGELQQIVAGRTAMTSLSLLLDACTAGYLTFGYKSTSQMIQTKTFSAQPFNHSYNNIPFWRPTRRVMSPNVSALAIAMSDHMSHDEKQYAIWKSALMRTSSRPVDMIFSIMGLFGVTLDTTAFDKNDRIGATIALAQKILEQGGRANWLGLSFDIDPCPFISTFPTFPRTRVSGKALVRIEDGKYREASELMENEYPIAAALVPMPQGSMDKDGYFTFVGKARRLAACPTPKDLSRNQTKPMHLIAMDGSSWEFFEEDMETATEDTCLAFAIVLGFFSEYFPGSTSAINDRNVRAILAEKHSPERYHVRSYFMLSGHSNVWLKEWPEREFSIGGPDVWGRQSITEDSSEPLDEISIVDMRLLANSPARRNKPISLIEHTERKARWAIPQLALEEHLLRESSN